LFDESTDAVVNIEASFCYGDISQFLAEAFRLLRPGGHLLYADLRLVEEVPQLRKAFLKSGFSVVGEEDISQNVVRAPELDSERRDDAGAIAPLPESSNLPLPELFLKKFGMQAGNIIGTASYMPSYTPPNYQTGQSPNATPNWMVGAAGAEVEVDKETGRVCILRLVNVCDIGKPINPAIVETQISGAAIMQLGFTMTENMVLRDGQLTNGSLADYKIPGFFDIPLKMENSIIEAEQHDGPFGAKGVGESGTFGVSPAVANAIDDAVGIRITNLPITPEAVFRALRSAAGAPLEDE
jgi:CO/xanthine dehydrogenase Mo-binding subunit